MRRRSVRAALAGLLVAGAVVAAAAPGGSAGAGERPRTKPAVRLVVLFDKGTPAAEQDDAAEAAGTVVHEIPQLRARVVEVSGSRARAVHQRLLGNPAVASVEVDPVKTIAATPDDPSFGAQASATRVNLQGAWDYTTGDPGTVIAIIDTGVNALFPDQVRSRFVAPINVLTGTANVGDEEGHGTSVASIAAASGNNNQQIAGACWSCSILPVKALTSGGFGLASDVALGMVWAVDHDADVINLSLSGRSSRIEKAAVDYAESNGVVVVAATGNGGSSTPSFPAAHPTVIGVAASSTASDAREPYSNFGSWAKVAVPGTNRAIDRTNEEVGFSGTSSAAPLVAGIVGLMLSENPSLTPVQVRTILAGAGPDVGYVSGGRVDAAAALAAVPGAAQSPVANTADGAPDLREPNPTDVSDAGFTHSRVVNVAISTVKAGPSLFEVRCAFCGGMTLEVRQGGTVLASTSGGQALSVPANLPTDGTYTWRVTTERWGLVSYVITYLQ